MHRFSVTRAAITMIFIVGGLSALIVRVAYLQTYGREQTIRKAEGQQHQGEILYSRRGSIWDRTGLLMAGTVQTTSLFIDPWFMQKEYERNGWDPLEMDEALTKLAKFIDKSPLEIFKLLADRSESRYLRVADNLDPQTINAIQKLKLPGTGFTPINQRDYPMASIAAHILGGVGGDGKGLEGLELKYETTLAGKDGFKRTLKDGSRRRNPIAVDAEDYLAPQNGQHLVLSVDANIQMIAEQELSARCREVKAKRGEVVVMDPLTGEVLALANWPTFNPQNLEDSTADMRRDRCLTDPYEPGSTIKPFIAGPALAMGAVRLTEVFPIRGISYHSSLRSKPVTDIHGYGPMTLWDILVKSSNIGMTMLGERLGRDNVFGALRSWHFGDRTGIELPGEDPGYINRLASWKNVDVVSAVQGYSIMVTPLQLARGMCAYANGGHLVRPQIVHGVLDDDGVVVSQFPVVPLKNTPQVIDPAAALQIRRILADVPIRGTATKGRLATWNIFGKTGTAHISQGKAGYNESAYTSSFIGGAPFENPRLVIAMIIHEPRVEGKNYYGGTISAPPAAEVLRRSLAYLQVPASPDLAPPPPQIANLLVNYDPKVYARRTASAKE